MNRYAFQQVALLPADQDNVAIAIQIIEAGSIIQYQEASLRISHTVLEGHRFAVGAISAGDHLLSWGLPFGTATVDISVGDYVCNPKMLAALQGRNLDFELPTGPNFNDDIPSFDRIDFEADQQISRSATDRYFSGFLRSGGRGVGTRNYIAAIGATSRTASFAQALAARFNTDKYTNIDGVVAVTHTEGGEDLRPNNFDMMLRTIAGFATHPNIGAFLMVDYSTEPINNRILKDFLNQNQNDISSYPLQEMPHQFLSIRGGFENHLDQASRIIQGWLPKVNQTERTPQPLDHLKIALQCGGSDAFSGVSGNPLAGYVAKEVIRYGGSANLAETDELIGAESYALQKVKSPEIAQRFLAIQDRFQQRASWHGHSAAGNPSGGNLYRGLYNIAIKSIGAAMKRHPDVRLDAAIDYAGPMTEAGYYFMDSPGNDLESIAGQVASGCNMIFFVTGNGSITNFPFVPTIKIVTTTDRYNLLKDDMDVNAGQYQDGIPLEQIGQEMFQLTLDVASGQRSIGEEAGHSQISVWRNWRQTDGAKLKQLQSDPDPDGIPIPIQTDTADLPLPTRDISEQTSQFCFQGVQTENGVCSNQIGLVLPTSLCSGQIADLIAKRLNAKQLGKEQGISQFHGLSHTEGCGVSGGRSEEMFARVLVGHLLHPTVGFGVLLEHGCEKTHNDFIRQVLAQRDINSDQFGWASVQLDGGIETVSHKVEDWFQQRLAQKSEVSLAEGSLADLRIGLLSFGTINSSAAATLTQLAQIAVAAGGTVVIPDNATLIDIDAFSTMVGHRQTPQKSLAYGESRVRPGLHIMDTQTGQAVETLTGLGATGVDLIIAHLAGTPIQSHRMIPVVQISTDPETIETFSSDLDLAEEVLDLQQLFDLISEVASRRYLPRLHDYGNTDFQVTRGLLGISL